MKFTAFSYGKFDFMEKFNSELDVQVKESNRGRIVFIVPAGLMLFFNARKNLKLKVINNNFFMNELCCEFQNAHGEVFFTKHY